MIAVSRMKNRLERDFLGVMRVPKDVYWGINTARTLQNFKISGRRFPITFLLALAQVKKACADANLRLGQIDQKKGRAILRALDEILLKNKFRDQFPVDIFQAGSGTQTNMNMNEVVANRANEILGYPLGKKFPVHPNDDVNKSQSSNDVIPTAMNLSAIESVRSELFPALELLKKSLRKKAVELKDIIKVGRTHLQDALPIRLSTEFSVYAKQVSTCEARLKNACRELCQVPIGGTAVGTGLDAEADFGKVVVENLRNATGYPFKLNPVKAEGIASHNSIAEMSAELRLLALGVLKMSNDIRWMGSGPRAGLGELLLPENEPGSSIMPGKINPTQAEMLIQVCLQVIGNDTTVSLGEAFGSTLELNVAKPLIIVNLLDSVEVFANAIRSFVVNCLEGLKANAAHIDLQMERNLMVVTRLVPIIGYDKASEVARVAVKTGKTIMQVVKEMGIAVEGDLNEILNPRKMV